MSPQESRRLHKAIVSVLSRALECCLHPAPDFRDPEVVVPGAGKNSSRLRPRGENPAAAAENNPAHRPKADAQLTSVGAAKVSATS